MNTPWLLKSRTVWGALLCSGVLSTATLWLLPGGLPAVHKQQAELQRQREVLLTLNRRNRELFDEVQRLAMRDPELMEALARRQGFARPGETIYTFRDRGERK
ncbi:MAG: septum formation initiator family protein [Holophagaceae bacterium]|nr:septum formation initiator family protein [Holophagaceae bacterium]